MPPSKSAKGATFELALSSLILFQSRGALNLAVPTVDDADVDRFLIRPLAGKAAFLQLKSRAAPLSRGYLELRFAPIANAASRSDLYLVAGELTTTSPFVGPRFAMIPASELPPASPTGQIGISIPLKRGSTSRYARFVHDLKDLATLLSARLDGGPKYAYPPAQAGRLSTRAAGRIIEEQVAAAILSSAGGGLHLWWPVVDDFGEDIAVTDRSREAALRIQPKGTVGLSESHIDVKIRGSTFKPSEVDYFVFANFDPNAMALSPHLFVIRGDHLSKVAEKKGENYRFRGRPDPARAGSLAPYLFRVEELGRLLQAALAARKARMALPTRL